MSGRARNPNIEWGFHIVIPRIVRIKYTECTHAEKWLYACLKDLCGESGMCFRTLEVLSEETGISTGSLSAMIPHLHAVGLIHAEKKKRKEGGKAVWHISIVDIWQENARECSISEHSPTQNVQKLKNNLQNLNDNLQNLNENVQNLNGKGKVRSNFADRSRIITEAGSIEAGSGEATRVDGTKPESSSNDSSPSFSPASFDQHPLCPYILYDNFADPHEVTILLTGIEDEDKARRRSAAQLHYAFTLQEREVTIRFVREVESIVVSARPAAPPEPETEDDTPTEESPAVRRSSAATATLTPPALPTVSEAPPALTVAQQRIARYKAIYLLASREYGAKLLPTRDNEEGAKLLVESEIADADIETTIRGILSNADQFDAKQFSLLVVAKRVPVYCRAQPVGAGVNGNGKRASPGNLAEPPQFPARGDTWRGPDGNLQVFWDHRWMSVEEADAVGYNGGFGVYN